MNPLAQLDQLNLDPAAKTQLAVMLQTLLEQAKQNAAALQTKDAALQAQAAEIRFKDQ